MLHDNDPMPFGKYKGKPMVNIPAKYFLYLLDNDYFKGYRSAEVKQYVLSNLEVLKKRE